MNDNDIDDYESIVGPTHYEGWTCEGCKWLTETTHFYCFEPNVRSSHIDNKIEDRMHTPHWCPYKKVAIINHIVEDR